MALEFESQPIVLRSLVERALRIGGQDRIGASHLNHCQEACGPQPNGVFRVCETTNGVLNALRFHRGHRTDLSPGTSKKAQGIVTQSDPFKRGLIPGIWNSVGSQRVKEWAQLTRLARETISKIEADDEEIAKLPAGRHADRLTLFGGEMRQQ